MNTIEIQNINQQYNTAELTLRQVFERHSDRPWIFVRPGGNWGDYLIYAGAEKIADSLGLRWLSCDTEAFQSVVTTPDCCIYLHGGGGFNSWCSGRAFLNLELALARAVHLVVQGPQSAERNREWLATRFKAALSSVNCHHCIFFAREDVTFGLLQDLSLNAYGVTVCRDHDTALSLEAKDLLSIAKLAEMPAGKYDLTVIREDNEQPSAATRNAASIVKATPTGVTLDPAHATSFSHWVRIHLYARSITTNRLHSSIVGIIAGKSVAIGPGSYHKNRSVWLYSMKGRGVQWVDQIVPPARGLWHLLPQKIQNSYKARQLRLAFHGVPRC